MAKTLRIDDVVVTGDTVAFAYTYGDGLVLPANPSGLGITKVRTALVTEAEEFEANQDAVLAMLLLARVNKALRVDSSLGTAFKTACKGTASIDLTGGASGVVLT